MSCVSVLKPSELLRQTYIKVCLPKQNNRHGPNRNYSTQINVFGVGPHLYGHRATSKPIDTVETVARSSIDCRHKVIIWTPAESFLVKGPTYIFIIAMQVSIWKLAWFTAFSHFDVRYAMAMAPVKLLDKVARATSSRPIVAIKKKI